LPFDKIVKLIFSVNCWFSSILFLIVIIRAVMKRAGRNVDERFLDAIVKDRERTIDKE